MHSQPRIRRDVAGNCLPDGPVPRPHIVSHPLSQLKTHIPQPNMGAKTTGPHTAKSCSQLLQLARALKAQNCCVQAPLPLPLPLPPTCPQSVHNHHHKIFVDKHTLKRNTGGQFILPCCLLCGSSLQKGQYSSSTRRTSHPGRRQHSLAHKRPFLVAVWAAADTHQHVTTQTCTLHAHTM